MLKGFGVDILHLPRIASLVSKRGTDRLAKRILSAAEVEDLKRVTDPSQIARFLAVRFSVKEAAYKALYPLAKPTWKELSYRGFGQSGKNSKPELIYHPSVDANKEKWEILVSVSHDGDYVYSSVIVKDIP